MPVAHAVLIPIPSLPASCLHDGEVTDISLVTDFQIHTDAEVDTSSWTKDIQVRDPTFYDFREDFAGALVCGHPDARFMARVQVLSDDGRQFRGRDFVEGIAFLFVGVGKGDAAWVAVGNGCFD